MITKPHERKKILKKAKKFFTDGIMYDDEKLLIGSYQLIKAIAKTDPSNMSTHLLLQLTMPYLNLTKQMQK